MWDELHEGENRVSVEGRGHILIEPKNSRLLLFETGNISGSESEESILEDRSTNGDLDASTSLALI